MENEELISIAEKAMKNAYAPYSKFKVGAAVLCGDGSVYGGCNIENSSYGATMCAERTAIFKAVSEGKRKLKKIAIVSVTNDITYPCGMCRQVMNEFMPDGCVIMKEKSGRIIEIKVSDLLPHAFLL
ncbi:MAG: cytidine deaminase [Clostridia bacterium]|nr:cytidine deaminase [Clostridia bacterium]